MPAIEVEDLRVSHPVRGAPDVEAVRGVGFTVDSGEVFALLGPNGAGKTSLLEVCEGFRPATSGRVRVLGVDPADRAGSARLRRDVGVVLQEIAVEPFLTVAEAVRRNAGYYGRRARGVADVLTAVGLTGKADARVRTLSGGQQRRLDLALGIVGRPRLLFLDEPTTGFDPSARREAWEVVRGLRSDGTTVVLTTHYLDEAEALADRVCVLAAGVVVATGPPGSLGGRSDAPATVRFALPAGLLPSQLPTLPADTTAYDGRTVAVTTADPTRTLHSLTGWALQRGLRLEGLAVERPSLEDVYLELTR